MDPDATRALAIGSIARAVGAYNATVSTRSAEYLEAIDHLPVGAVLVIEDVPWAEYEELVNDLERPGLRVSYDRGRLEIMSPGPKHERYKDHVSLLVRAFAEESDVPLETFGSTTWKRRALERGVEPDICFYVVNADRVIGRSDIDLETDPPPDVAVEIETTRASISKFPIYAALGVPEMWRYDGRRLRMYRRQVESYLETDTSVVFPDLPSSLLTEFLELCTSKGQTTALKAFRQRLRERAS